MWIGAKLKRLFKIHERIKSINIDTKLFERTCEIFTEYQGLSITDASIIAAMEKVGMKTLCSFDRGFDKIKWVAIRRSNEIANDVSASNGKYL